MANFNVNCPKSYPNKCNLVFSERKELEKKEKYKGFFMYQFEGNDPFLIETINEYFKSPDYHIFNAKIEPGTGIKICKICQLALACDFGIACLSPENYNVFMEIGMIFGLGKPCIMIYNKDKLNLKDPDKLPFDINAFTYIGYSSKDSLLKGLKREVSHFIAKLKIFTDAEKAIRDNIIRRLEAFPKESLILLKEFVAEGKIGFNTDQFLKWQIEKIKKFGWNVNEYYGNKLIHSFIMEHKVGGIHRVSLEEGYRDFLEQYLWSDDFEELLKRK